MKLETVVGSAVRSDHQLIWLRDRQGRLRSIRKPLKLEVFSRDNPTWEKRFLKMGWDIEHVQKRIGLNSPQPLIRATTVSFDAFARTSIYADNQDVVSPELFYPLRPVRDIRLDELDIAEGMRVVEAQGSGLLRPIHSYDAVEELDNPSVSLLHSEEDSEDTDPTCLPHSYGESLRIVSLCFDAPRAILYGKEPWKGLRVKAFLHGNCFSDRICEAADQQQDEHHVVHEIDCNFEGLVDAIKEIDADIVLSNGWSFIERLSPRTEWWMFGRVPPMGTEGVSYFLRKQWREQNCWGRTLWDVQDLRRQNLFSHLQWAEFAKTTLATSKAYTSGMTLDLRQLKHATDYDVVPLPDRDHVPLIQPLDMALAVSGSITYTPIGNIYSEVYEIDYSSMFPTIVVTERLTYEPWEEILPRTLKEGVRDIRAVRRVRNAKRASNSRDLWEWEHRADAMKGLLVTSYGYARSGFNRFSRPEMQARIAQISQRLMLEASRYAIEMGYRVLLINADALFVQRMPGSEVEVSEIVDWMSKNAGIPCEIDHHYRWIAFLEDSKHPELIQMKRYYGLTVDDIPVVRGIQARRRDSPPFIQNAQRKLIQKVLKHRDLESMRSDLPKIEQFIRETSHRIVSKKIPLEELAIKFKPRKTSKEYKANIPIKRVIAQWEKQETESVPRYLRYVHTAGGVLALDLHEGDNGEEEVIIDSNKYRILWQRAAAVVLRPVLNALNLVKGS